MNLKNLFMGLAGGDELVTVLTEVDRILDTGEPVSPLIGDAESSAAELAFQRAFDRRTRLFSASYWTLDQAIALFIGFSDIQMVPKDEFFRAHLRRFCGPKRDSRAMREIFDESLQHEADVWIQAVDSCRGHFTINGNRMHPMLWMRWVSTHAPQLVHPVFWTEFGLWRSGNFAVSQPMVRGSHDHGASMVCGDSEGIAHGLMPIDAFIHEPIDERDYFASIELVEVFNGNLVRKGLADFIVSKRSNASKRARTQTRFDKVRSRVGPMAMHTIERVLASLYDEQGKSRGWTYPYGGRLLRLTVKESRDELADLVVAHAVKLSFAPLSMSVTKSALSAFVEFPLGRRRQLS